MPSPVVLTMRPLCSAIFGIDQFAAMRSEPCEGAGFVLTHEPAVSGDIGGENGREPAFDPLSAQWLLPGRLPRFSVCASDGR